jgi:glucosamine--fructose-6-phosphate aminotransferase (isomerizing)
MCGIIGVVRRRATRPPPEIPALVTSLDQAVAALTDWAGDLAALERAATALSTVDSALRGVPGVRALLADAAAGQRLDERAERAAAALAVIENQLDAGAHPPASVALEALNATLLAVRDPLWAIRHDRLRAARAVADLAGPDASVAAIEAFTSVQTALSAIDRLEVRGRDSAGVHLLVSGHGLDLDDPRTASRLEERSADPLFGSGSIRAADGRLVFVYKAAAEIGELGDNTRRLRAAIGDDELLHEAVSADTVEVTLLGHTRWASVGIISEANAHPLNGEEAGRDAAYVAAALNGDVDNYAELIAGDDLHVPAEITTDTKVIPMLTARRRAEGRTPTDAFRAAVTTLEGSVAVAATQAEQPDALFLALRGSGQALYVGLAEDAFVVASEPYGLVEETSRYIRLDGETPADPRRPAATRGQVVVVHGAAAGTLDGIERRAYDGTPLPVTDADVQRAQITTRDIDRGTFPHYLLKEISEAPDSFRKTLRGKIVTGSEPGGTDGPPTVQLGPETLPPLLLERLGDGTIRRVVVIGQGTAAVAGQSLALALADVLDGRLTVDALHATELSGFGLRDDMRDTLVVAISQSGTTTDTNRTVDLSRARGATVVSIVNRRNSDLVDKSDGVLYTSDGRDVEMSVASTKAFYAQVAAGHLLAVALAAELGVESARSGEILAALRALPDAMRAVIALRPVIAGVAQRHVLTRRYWAVVGNGRNVVAARELRIKLSELCYKAIACDVTEDKKHIDLSSEPLVLVCAAGLGGSNVDDVTKEVAIYGAHRAAPIVIVGEDDAPRFAHALEVVAVPAVDAALDFVLSTVAGHLFCYEAALAIDGSARPLRECRAAIEAAAAGPPEELLDRLAPALDGPAQRFLDGLRAGQYDGTLEASTATRVASLLRYAAGVVPLDAYEVEHGLVGTPSTVVQDLTAALTRAIEELTRPVDAIKHQAKTVTVGISRSDETLLQVPLVREVLAAGAPRDGLSYRALRTLAELDPAVDAVHGYTRYRIEGDVGGDHASAHVVDRGGVAATITSRTDADPRLRGTKHRIANQREVTAVRGRADGRTLVIVPEVKHNQTVGLTLLHVEFADLLAADAMRGVLEGYQGRYGALKDAVTETETSFDDDVLARVPVVELLTDPVYVLADRWRRP